MSDIFWLVKNTIRVLLRNKKGLLITFGLPILGILISFLSYGGSGQTPLHVGVVNNDSSYIAKDTVQFVSGLKNVQVTNLTKPGVKDTLTSGKVDCVITIEPGFSQQIMSGNPGNIQITSIKGASVTSFVNVYLNEYVSNLIAIGKITNGNTNTFDQLYQNYKQSSFKVATNTLHDISKNKNMTYQSIGYLIMFMLFAAIHLSAIMTREKENRTYFRLVSSPIDANKYVISNILVNIIILTAQIILTLIIMINVLHIGIGLPFWQMLVVMMVFALVAVGISLVIVAFASSSSAANSFTNLIITPTCLLAGCFFPIDMMPKTLQKIADFMPQRWVLDIITKLQQGTSFESLYLNIMILLAFAIAFFLLAIYKFSRNNSVKNYI